LPITKKIKKKSRRRKKRLKIKSGVFVASR
jgi:hypothetical protein